MTREDLIPAIRNIIAEKFPQVSLANFSADTRLYEDLYFDSILLMQLLVHIELTLKVDIPDTALNKDDFHTIENLADFILRCQETPETPQQDVSEPISVDDTVEEFEDIKVHCFVSCVCEIVKADSRVDHRPFYFGVWDAEIIIDDDYALNYHSQNITHDFFIHWFKALYGVSVNPWYRKSLSKSDNIDNLLTLLDNKKETQHIMTMIDMFRLPERENRFNRDPFPHYVMLENHEDSHLLFMSDPDFRWEGTQKKSQVLDALASDAVEGGYIFDSKEITPTEDLAIYNYFIACFNENNNELTTKARTVIEMYAAEQHGKNLSMLHEALEQLPILAIRKYAYEHGLAFFWRALELQDQEFEDWCIVIEELVSSYKKVQYRALKMAESNYSAAQKLETVMEMKAILDQQDAREFKIKSRLKAVFDQWCENTLPHLAPQKPSHVEAV